MLPHVHFALGLAVRVTLSGAWRASQPSLAERRVATFKMPILIFDSGRPRALHGSSSPAHYLAIRMPDSSSPAPISRLKSCARRAPPAGQRMRGGCRARPRDDRDEEIRIRRRRSFFRAWASRPASPGRAVAGSPRNQRPDNLGAVPFPFRRDRAPLFQILNVRKQ
jgi:hypothetical protein